MRSPPWLALDGDPGGPMRPFFLVVLVVAFLAVGVASAVAQKPTFKTPPAAAVTAPAEARPYKAPRHAVFGGVGPAQSGDPSTSSATPWSIGYIYFGGPTNRYYFGADFSGEGTSLNNTTGQSNTPEQGLALDLLAGIRLNPGSRWQVSVGAMLGARQTGKSCGSSGDSYLGYDCYADQEPDRTYAVNYGATAHLVIDRILLGVRATGESYQFQFGIAF